MGVMDLIKKNFVTLFVMLFFPFLLIYDSIKRKDKGDLLFDINSVTISPLVIIILLIIYLHFHPNKAMDYVLIILFGIFFINISLIGIKYPQKIGEIAKFKIKHNYPDEYFSTRVLGRDPKAIIKNAMTVSRIAAVPGLILGILLIAYAVYKLAFIF